MAEATHNAAASPVSLIKSFFPESANGLDAALLRNVPVRLVTMPKQKPLAKFSEGLFQFSSGLPPGSDN
jgi:hypothetical protein